MSAFQLSGGKPTHMSPPRRAAVAADLQVGDVSVDAHGGRHAVLGHVLVVAGARLAVHSVHTGDGDPLVASSDVSATGEGTSPSCDKCCLTGTGLGRVSQLRRSRSGPDALPQRLGHLTCSPSSPWAQACLGLRLEVPCSSAARPTPES